MYIHCHSIVWIGLKGEVTTKNTPRFNLGECKFLVGMTPAPPSVDMLCMHVCCTHSVNVLGKCKHQQDIAMYFQ